MPGKTRPYEQFGPYLLFKKLESDALGELWRAARIDDRHLGPLVALRRLTGGNREALLQNTSEARVIAPLLEGALFVKGQVIDSLGGVPFVAHEYGSGRSLGHIVERARGGAGMAPNPIPIDQAILIAERLALSLQTVGDLKFGAVRLMHGALLPQFVWITDDGEIRVAGQQMGKGLVASLKDAKVAGAIGRYFSPEYQQSAEPTRASEVFSLGALFFLLLTGHEPPDAPSVSAFSQTIRAAKTMAGQPLPDDIRAVLDRSLIIDASRRFGSVADMKQALTALVNSGKYSATTFNLAFYVSSLLKKELEGEALDRDKESKVNIAPYLESVVTTAAPPPQLEAEARRMNPVVPIAAVIALAAIGAGAYFLMRTSPSKAAVPDTPLKPAAQNRIAPAVKPSVPSPLTAAVVTATAPQSATADPAAEKKAFEAAVNQKFQEEVLKLQTQFNKQLEQDKPKPAPPPSRPAPVLTASAAPPQRSAQSEEDRAPSAASLDEQRLAARQQAAVTSTTQVPAAQPQLPPQSQPQSPPAAVPTQTAPPPSPAPVQPPAIREGDLVNFDELDVRPQPQSAARLIYPPMAMREHIEASLILTVLVSESGQVIDVKVLRGDKRFGFEDEAMRALRASRFTPAMKDGKHVKTWIPQPVQFKLK